MKTKIISLLTLISVSILSAEKITVAIPDFANLTAGHVTRIAPGEYQEKNVKVGEDKRKESYQQDGRSVQTESKRDVYEKQLERFVEYAPGAWALPSKAETVAADELASGLVGSGIDVLTRNTHTQKTREQELTLQQINNPSSEFLSLYRDLNADYIIIGRIAGFRIDETSGNAYGVTYRRTNTRISGDIQVVDAVTGKIAAQTPILENISRRLPDGVSTTVTSDWETPLRVAIKRVAPKLIEQVVAGNSDQLPKLNEISVEVNSTPTGADILVGDLFVGNTPASVPLEEGRSEIRIEKQGYQSWARQVKVHKDLKINVTLNETPKASNLEEDEVE